MNRLILNISPDGFLIYFALFSFITLFLAMAIYLLLSSNRFRRGQYRSTATPSKTLSLLLVAPLTGVLLWYFYIDSWGHFFSLRMHDDSVELGYYFPERAVMLDHKEELSFRVTSHVRKGGTQYRLVLQMDDQNYSSQLINRHNIKPVVEALQTALGNTQ